MSHLTCSKIKIMDLDILKKAVAGFGGLRFNENVKTFESYYCHRKSKEAGMALDGQINRLGTLEHSISILNGSKVNQGRGYEIGVIKSKDGEGFVLMFDPYDSTNARIVGAQCEKVMSAYAEAYCSDFAEKSGFLMEQALDDEGNIVITMTAN